MSDTTPIPEDAEGKRVINALGDDIGRVVDVSEGVAHVELDPTVTQTLLETLGWDSETEPYRLDPAHVETVDEDRIHLTH